MKKTRIIFVILALIFALVFLFSVNIKASDDIRTKDYKADISEEDTNGLFEKAQPILTILRGLSIIVAILSLSILGIKYMIGSVEQKASYKEKLIPIVIGAVLISGLTSILISINSIMNASSGGATGGGGGGPGESLVNMEN